MRKLVNYLQSVMLALILIPAFLFMLQAAKGDSAIFDETAHIVAGYNYVRNLDYRFNPEHPPIVKIAAGLPLLSQNLNFSTEKGYWNGLNEQWWAGNDFLYKSGNDADKIIIWSRIGPILITLLAIFFVYFFAKEIIGRWWAFFPAFLFGFSPIVLAHGHYVTTDIGETLAVMLFIYALLKFLFEQSRKNLIWAGLAFGFAQAVKFSSILLIPYLFIIAGVFYFLKRKEARMAKYLLNAVLIIFIGYAAIVYPLYLLTTWNYPLEKQVIDTQALIQNFKIKQLADLNIWMAGNNVLRPFGEYLLGVLMVLQRSAGGNSAYFFGELSSHGWWYYFPLVYLMKEPLPILAMVFIGLMLGFWRITAAFAGLRYKIGLIPVKFREYLNVRFTEFSFLVFIAIYWFSSIASPLNIGVRHILPTLPFIYILASGAIKNWFLSQPYQIPFNAWETTENFIHSVLSFWVKTFILSALAVWLIAETTIAAPYFLSYFNEFSGWRENGFYYVTDSNFDWGQDLKRLQKWVQVNIGPEEKIAVDYFGGGDPAYYLGNQFVPWWSAKGNPKDEGISWLAISVNTFQGALAKPVADFYKNPADEYRWLENPYGFIDRAGTAIFIYKL